MAADSRLVRLIDFYQRCLAHEFTGLGSHVLLDRGPNPLLGEVSLSDDQYRAIAKVAGQAGHGGLAAGWPILGSGDEHHVLFVVPVELASDRRRHRLLPLGRPELNADGLGVLVKSLPERDALVDLVSDLDEADRESWLTAALGLITDATGTPRLDRPLGSLGGRSAQLRCEAAVFRPEPSGGIVYHLTRDLAALTRLGAKVADTALGALVADEPLAADPRAPRPLPLVLPANSEQELAIDAALTSRLTVVTGPPGTGKSQVLANAVAAALNDGLTVLLASKNNQAVDVVVDRLNRTAPEALVVRTGSKAIIERVTAGQLGTFAAGATAATDLLPDARAAWQEQATAVGRAYELLHRSARLEQAAKAARAEARALRDEVPLELRDSSAGEADALGIVAAVVDEAKAWDPTPPRRPWRPWPRRRTAAPPDPLTKLTALLADGDPGRADAIERARLAGGRDAVLDIAVRLRRAELADRELKRADDELAGLPPPDELAAACDEAREAYREQALELFRASWHDRTRRPSDSAARARSYAERAAQAAAAGRSLQRISSGFPDVLAALPVWAVSSMSVAGTMPLQPGLFDLVIIDEATQHDLASALPLLFRAKRALVIGDPNQLSHITTVREAAESKAARAAELSDDELARFSYMSATLYDAARAATRAEPVVLRQHFRSVPEVIGFSNRTFYGSQLEVRTPASVAMPGPALRWIDVVASSYSRGPSGHSLLVPDEVDATVDVALEQLTELEGTGRDLGIITPFRAQANAIRDRIVDSGDTAAKAVTSGLLSVDTVYRFQGSERDVIVFSPCVTADLPPALTRIAGRRNTVNVTVTRARARLVVVGDHQACLSSETVLAELAKELG